MLAQHPGLLPLDVVVGERGHGGVRLPLLRDGALVVNQDLERHAAVLEQRVGGDGVRGNVLLAGDGEEGIRLPLALPLVLLPRPLRVKVRVGVAQRPVAVPLRLDVRAVRLRGIKDRAEQVLGQWITGA